MPLNTVPGVVSGQLMTAAWFNTYIRDNINNMDIRSLQRGTISFAASGSNTPTATIASVITGKAECHFMGVITDSPSIYAGARIELTNATTVTAVRDNITNGAAMVVGYEVVEHY